MKNPGIDSRSICPPAWFVNIGQRGHTSAAFGGSASGSDRGEY
jgi:hypothetical protein